jgi:titin
MFGHLLRRWLSGTPSGRPAHRPAVRPCGCRPRLEALEERSVPAVITVFNTLDSGAGSLRQAIISSNLNPGPDTINFNIPGAGAHVFVPATALPAVTDAVTIDGTSQPGYAGTPLIEIFGNGTLPFGLVLQTNGCTLKGLEFTDCPQYGLDLSGASANVVTNCSLIGNGVGGAILFTGSQFNTFGGSAAAANELSGNGQFGIVLVGSGVNGNLIANNDIGTDRTGMNDLGNGVAGVLVLAGASSNSVLGNVISDNLVYGVAIVQAGTNGNTLGGNLIGLNASGNAAPNGFAGVYVGMGAAGNVVGSLTPGYRNVISANGYDGVLLDGSGTTVNLVQNNLIGVAGDGATNRANVAFGVVIQDGSGGNAVANNVIGFNHQAGVLLDGSSGDILTGNLVGVSASGGNIGSVGPGIWLRDGSSGNLLSGNAVGGQSLIGDGGVQLDGPGTTGNILQGNTIGLNAAGAAVINATGVLIENGASGNLVGGPTRASANVISANVGGDVVITGTGTNGNVVQSNFIGTNAAGSALSSTAANALGVIIENGASGNFIGGIGAGNVISGHSNSGLGILIDAANGNGVYGNFIGTDATGTVAVPNFDGIDIQGGAQNNIIGGPSPALANVVAGNAGFGIQIFGGNTTGNVVQGNRIGIGLNAAPLANGLGVLIENGASNNLIGGTAPGDGNYIDFNTGKGVVIGYATNDTTAVGNAVLGNNIFGNGGPGIDLGNDGVTANTPGSPHSGPNDLQSFPVLNQAHLAGAVLFVSGTLNSQANSLFRVEFFASSQADGSGHGQGEDFLGYAVVSTDNTGNASFAVALPFAGAPGKIISATATRIQSPNTGNNLTFGDTSEFSTNITAS